MIGKRNIVIVNPNSFVESHRNLTNGDGAANNATPVTKLSIPEPHFLSSIFGKLSRSWFYFLGVFTMNRNSFTAAFVSGLRLSMPA